ncbi:DNA topoisomerase 3-alpha, partial [Fragariocoptes setiger]
MKVFNVAEKNDAAKNISAILSEGRNNRREGRSKYNKIYDFSCDVPSLGGHCGMTMTSVSGHLVAIDFGTACRNWASVPEETLFKEPIVKNYNNTSKQIKATLEAEAKKCRALIIWTDGDREGENIGFQIIDVCRRANPSLIVKRARFSEITPRAMRIAIQTLENPNELMSKAVDIRKELDLRFGAIFTRFQTMYAQRQLSQFLGNGKGILSYGPCQFPTLGFVVARYKEIVDFRSQNFWYIDVRHKKDGIDMSFNWKRARVFDENVCCALYSKIMERPVARVTSVSSKQKLHFRPYPMHTTVMEKLASQKLRMTAKRAMEVAEKLYNKGLISYPRTETNIFPQGLNLRDIVQAQTGHSVWGPFACWILDCGGPRARNGKKTDNAHPPIHPTKLADGNTFQSQEEARLYELITRHFLACVSKDAVGHETNVDIDINTEKFNTKGLIILEKNYLEVYPYLKWNAKEIARFDMNENFLPDSIMMYDGKTTPPWPLTESQLISLMEKHGIGTDATHAEHINTIQVRNYVKKMNNMHFVPCKIGLALYDGYADMREAAHFTKPFLRAQLERDLQSICDGQAVDTSVAQRYITEHKHIFRKIKESATRLDTAFRRSFGGEDPETAIRRIMRESSSTS